ncbi:LysR family transcriptional regulator [Pseudodonghicola flavimaris]|uniref:LysR family transcriptional regulator n=1 Tax=Pseudodonghicola flavimaris TaxID=3050036 RepID=A0ABT7F3M9_9RHOB|nr:LysR family transcriptional regulator [Pseudodonghicola flavimaris]MDK3019206.1 LysR family transcriptional regulator [Pseudodonghicola flavimaris]
MRAIETFVWAARLGSFQRAAEKMHSTLTTVSARIGSLERELGVELFLRRPRGVELTAKGREALPYAEAVTIAGATFASRIGASTQMQGHVRLGIIDMIAAAMLPQLLANLRDMFPNLDVDLRSGTSSELADMLANGELDLALIMRDVTITGMRELPLLRMKLHWIAPASLIGERSFLSAQELANLPILSFSPDTTLHRQVLGHLAGTRARRGIYSGTSMTAALKLLETGFGLAALPPSLVAEPLASGRLKLIASDMALPPLESKIAWMDGPNAPFLERIAEVARLSATQSIDAAREDVELLL